MRTKFKMSLLGVIFLLAISKTSSSHHSVSAEFDIEKRVSVTGVLIRAEWSNPHAWLQLNVKEEKTGKVASWAIVLPSPSMFARLGWERTPFKTGIMITADGFAAKDGSRKTHALYILTSDGQKLFVGLSAANK